MFLKSRLFSKNLFNFGRFQWPDSTRPLDPTDKLTNGRMAEALLADPMLNAVLAALKNKAHRDWELSAPDDIERQRIAHMRVTILRDILKELHSHIASAKKLEADLELKRSSDRAKEAGAMYGA